MKRQRIAWQKYLQKQFLSFKKSLYTKKNGKYTKNIWNNQGWELS